MNNLDQNLIVLKEIAQDIRKILWLLWVYLVQSLCLGGGGYLVAFYAERFGLIEGTLHAVITVALVVFIIFALTMDFHQESREDAIRSDYSGRIIRAVERQREQDQIFREVDKATIAEQNELLEAQEATIAEQLAIIATLSQGEGKSR